MGFSNLGLPLQTSALDSLLPCLKPLLCRVPHTMMSQRPWGGSAASPFSRAVGIRPWHRLRCEGQEKLDVRRHFGIAVCGRAGSGLAFGGTGPHVSVSVSAMAHWGQGDALPNPAPEWPRDQESLAGGPWWPKSLNGRARGGQVSEPVCSWSVCPIHAGTQELETALC